jgi:uncharacterized membrane protein
MYLFLKSFHILSVIVWMGGMIIIPTLASSMSGNQGVVSANRVLFTWFRRFVTPAMIATLGLGLWAAQSGGWFSDGWLQLKLLLVVGVTALHGIVSGRLRRASVSGEVDLSGLWKLSLLTGLLLLLIVLLVVRKTIF